MKVEVKQLPKSTVQLDVTVPVEKVKETYDEVLAEIAASAEIQGFRKGKAPKDIVEKSVDPAKFRGEVVNKLLEKYYVQALKENKLNPISNPKVEIERFNPEEDFEFIAKIAVRPDVELGDYMKALQERAEKKHEEVKKQKEEALKKGEDMKEIHDHLHTNEIIETIVEATEVEVPELLVEDEVNRMRTRLVNQMQNLDMDLQDYLKAQNKSSEQLNQELTEQAQKNLKAEFALAQAVKESDIEVTDEEIEETAKATGDPQAVENLKDPVHKWYIKSVLEKNKLLRGIMEELNEGDVADHGSNKKNKVEKKETDVEDTEDKEDKKEE